MIGTLNHIELLEEIVETTNEIVLEEAENVLSPSLTVEALAAANHFDLTENSGTVVKTLKLPFFTETVE